jgi:hypothetical protein
MVSAADCALFDYADSAEAGWGILVKRGLVAHCNSLPQP